MPSHSLKAGRRFAYYASRRLITGPADPSAWRLAAAALEKAVQRAVIGHLETCAARHDLLTEPDASTAEALHHRLADLIAKADCSASAPSIWDLIHRVDIAKGRLEIALDPAPLAAAVGLRAEALSPRSIAFQIPFQCRRRGVETRLIAGTPEPAPDAVLLRNLERAHRWLDAVRTGRLITDIARAEGVSESFVHNRLALAFLSPDFQKAIVLGTLDRRLTTDHMLRTGIARDWTRQSEGFGL